MHSTGGRFRQRGAFFALAAQSDRPRKWMPKTSCILPSIVLWAFGGENAAQLAPEAVCYDTGGCGYFTWPFGGQGNLFKYLYRDPSIIEIALVQGKVLASDKHLCAGTLGKRYLSFSSMQSTCRGEHQRQALSAMT
jgi:hypothetical protein